MVYEKEKTYQEEYEDFWKDIVENEDGTLNKDQVMRELSDYSMVMDNCEKAYSEMTNGKISKANTLFSEVENIFNEKYRSVDMYDAYGCIDDIEEILKIDNIEELKKQIRDYFGILESKGNEKLKQRGIAGVKVFVSNETYNNYKGTLQEQLEDYKSRCEEAQDLILNELSHLEANDEETWNKEFYDENNKLDYRKLCIEILNQAINLLDGGDK